MIDQDGRLLSRLAQIVVIAVLVAIGVNHVVFAIRDWPLGDMDVYLAAAQRLLDGEPLYVAGDVAVNSYWYAPWYALAWTPFTLVPREIVAIGWSAILLAGTAAVVWRLARLGRRGVALALLVGPPLFAVSAGGNVQSLMVLALLVGFHRRWGPLAVAAAASMKIAPILLVAAYVARREWGRAVLSLGLAAVLMIPSLVMGIADAGVRSEAAPSLLGISPVVYGAALVAALAATFLVARRHAVTAAAVATVLALPRLFVYDVSLVAIGVASREERRPESQGAPKSPKPGASI